MSLAADRRRKAKALEEAGAALSVKLLARSTRGKRVSELQGDDAEADETFWGQGAWQEAEEDDSEFSSEEGERKRNTCRVRASESAATSTIMCPVCVDGPPRLVEGETETSRFEFTASLFQSSLNGSRLCVGAASRQR